jgi:rhomboid protease GluP
MAERRMPSDVLGGLIPHARFTTMMILLINTGLYIATVVHGSQAGGGGWWRLITAGFLHGGVLHILMNSWVLFDVGAQVEESFGTSRFLVLYFISNITGFLVSTFWSPLTTSVGASAAIFGLIGAMIALGVRDRSSYGAAIRRLYMRWAVFALVMSLLPGIDMGAHIGGLAGGFIVAYLSGTPTYSPMVERVWKIMAVAALAITGVAFVEMFQFLMSPK